MRNRLNWGSLEPPEFGCVGLRFRQSPPIKGCCKQPKLPKVVINQGLTRLVLRLFPTQSQRHIPWRKIARGIMICLSIARRVRPCDAMPKSTG